MGAISYDDYKKKYGINIVRNSSLPKKYEKNKLKEELEDKGIVTGNNLLSRPGATTVQNKINEEKRKVPHLSKYNSDESNLIKISSREQENNKMYYKQEMKNLLQDTIIMLIKQKMTMKKQILS